VFQPKKEEEGREKRGEGQKARGGEAGKLGREVKGLEEFCSKVLVG